MSVQLSDYLDVINDLLPESSSERVFIERLARVLTQPAPTTLSESQIRVSTLDTLRVELSNLIFMVSNKISQKRKEYSELYNKEFTKYTNLGRPNQVAVDCEVMSRTPGLNNLKYTIECYENFRVLLNSYMKNLDQIRVTCIECWHDNRYSS